MSEPETFKPGSRWDSLREALQTQRAQVGNPSYAEIAERVAAARRDQGLNEHEARVARSTVYDLFTLGRPRINLDLVREIASTLGTDASDVEMWISACHEQQKPQPLSSDQADAEMSWHTQLLIAAACIALNVAGGWLTHTLQLPIFLDMVGTAVAVFVLGTWRGVAVGAATNLVLAFINGPALLAFLVVNVAGALVWGYGIHRFNMGSTLPRFFSLNLLVALACSLVAVPVIVLAFQSDIARTYNDLTLTLQSLGAGLLTAIGLSNIVHSAVDKLLSGFIALAIVAAMPIAWRRRTNLTL